VCSSDLRINNDDIWADVKAGKLKGFSVEGGFLFGKKTVEPYTFARFKNDYRSIRQKYKRVYSGLNEQEKRARDEVIWLIEQIGEDKYLNPQDAVKRSNELGLLGRIHSHTEEGKTYYMPGSNHDEYDTALLNMEIDVAALPDYTDPGATGELISESFVDKIPGEDKDAYISRCMSTLDGEFPDQDQRYAVCISDWESFSKDDEFYRPLTQFEKNIISQFIQDVKRTYNL
jgi:hypothetical protein